jgi:hypothetical protein
VVALETRLKQSEQENAELAAQLEVRERINSALVNQLEAGNQYLREQAERLQRQLRELEEKNRQHVELTTLLKEELAWFKAQIYGRSSEKSSSDVSADQGMLFNEAEVLTAIVKRHRHGSRCGHHHRGARTAQEAGQEGDPGRVSAYPGGARHRRSGQDLPARRHDAQAHRS